MYALNTSMNRTRSDYYQGNYTPHMFTNGFDSGSSLNAWVEHPKKYMNEVSFLELSFKEQLITIIIILLLQQKV